jgi:hypothetical protein
MNDEYSNQNEFLWPVLRRVLSDEDFISLLASFLTLGLTGAKGGNVRKIGGNFICSNRRYKFNLFAFCKHYSLFVLIDGSGVIANFYSASFQQRRILLRCEFYRKEVAKSRNHRQNTKSHPSKKLFFFTHKNKNHK